MLKACAFDPKDRYRSAEEMLYALGKLYTPTRENTAGASIPGSKQFIGSAEIVGNDAELKEKEEELSTIGPFKKKKEKLRQKRNTSGDRCGFR